MVKSASALAVVALAVPSMASDVPKPYEPKLMKMSAHELFGLERRQDSNGYTPSQSVCGTGSTCAEACGAGYETCTSSDSTVHCFHPSAGQTCCPDASGSMCYSNYLLSSQITRELSKLTHTPSVCSQLHAMRDTTAP
jgi:hypothetical protein